MKHTIIIGIAGGTASGKSTFTRRLKERFKKNVVILHHDDYYRDQAEIDPEERRKINYDHPDALDTELLLSHLAMLQDGKAISCPVYDFTNNTRSHKTIRIEPAPIVILEGILVLSDPALRERMDLKIFVHADADDRLARRILRDVRDRKRDLRGIIRQYQNTVKPMHNQYVEPARQEADIVLNGGTNQLAFAVVEAYLEKQLE